MVHIQTDIDNIDVEASLEALSAQRRERVLAMKNWHVRRQSVAAYLLLCHALVADGYVDSLQIHDDDKADAPGAALWPPVFSYGAHGKPSLRDYPGVHFSMSHCRSAVACAVSDAPVGIDIEEVGRYSSDIVRHTMNEREQEQIFTSISPPHEFMRLWTMKEALLKLTGEGLSSGLRDALANHTDVRFVYPDTAQESLLCTLCTYI